MKRILSFVIGLAFCFSAAIASASTVTLTGSYNSGVGGGITGFDKWDGLDGSGNPLVTLDWNASPNIGDGTWTYTYTWTGANRDISHFNIQVSDGFTEANVIFYSAFPGPGNTKVEIGTFDNNTWKAFKFDNLGNYLTQTFSLTSNRMPMDGNFYAKDGGVTRAHNAEGFYVAVPNSAVPIPSTILLLGAGLAGIVGFRRKKIAK